MTSRTCASSSENIPRDLRNYMTLVRRWPGLHEIGPTGYHPVRRGGATGQIVPSYTDGKRTAPCHPDEPTTGLHVETSTSCCSVLHRWWTSGDTVLVIEHNLDVIKTAD